MQTPPRGLLKHHILWGLGLGAAAVASTQILTWMGLGLSNLTWISTYTLIVVFAVLAGRSLRGRLDRRPGFLQAVLMLLVMLLVSRLMYQTYMFLYINFVDPDWVDTVADVWSGQLRESGSTEEAIEKSISRFRRQWETKFVFTLGIIAYALPEFVLGLVALVVSAVQPWKKDGGARARA